MTRVEFDSEEYNTFLRCLTNLKEICNDVEIREGVIRQRTNDLTSVFEMDLTTILDDATLPVTNIKKKLDIFKLFAGRDDVAIEIVQGETESDSYFTLADEQTQIKFLFPALEFMDNKFMTERERDGIFLLNEDELMLQDQLDQVVAERIRVITDNFNIQSLQVKYEGDKATIRAATQSKDQIVNFKGDIPANMEFEGIYLSNLSVVPFCVEHDTNLEFKMYKDPNQNLTYNSIKTALGDVEIRVYSRAALVEHQQ